MKAVLEGLLFLKGSDGLTLSELTNLLEVDKDLVKQLIQELYQDYQSEERGLQLELLGDHFKLTTKQIHQDYYKKLVTEEEKNGLSQSALETLAIIAYNEPITRVEIDEIRGINSTYLIRTLMIKGLIEEVGKSDLPGHPRQFGVTNAFLDYFGLGSIDELPKLVIPEADETEANLFDSRYKEENMD